MTNKEQILKLEHEYEEIRQAVEMHMKAMGIIRNQINELKALTLEELLCEVEWILTFDFKTKEAYLKPSEDQKNILNWKNRFFNSYPFKDYQVLKLKKVYISINRNDIAIYLNKQEIPFIDIIQYYGLETKVSDLLLRSEIELQTSLDLIRNCKNLLHED